MAYKTSFRRVLQVIGDVLVLAVIVALMVAVLWWASATGGR
jgi:hypothetical protein